MSGAKTYPAVEDLLPHRGPSLLVTAIAEELEDGIVCLGSVPAGHALAAHGKAPAVLGLELGAQTAAVMGALALHRSEAGLESPRMGYLVGIRGAAFEVPELPVGEPLRATVRPTGGAAALSFYSVQIALEADGRELVRGTISTWLLDAAPGGRA